MNLFKIYLQKISIFNKKSTKYIQQNNNVIETTFTFDQNQKVRFKYQVKGGFLICTAYILDYFQAEQTSDILTLSQYLNSISAEGKIKINYHNRNVKFIIKEIINRNRHNKDYTFSRLTRHYKKAKEIFNALNSLTNDRKDLALIIADIMIMRSQN